MAGARALAGGASMARSKKGFDRRGFLKSTATGAAAALVAPGAAAPAQAQTPAAPRNATAVPNTTTVAADMGARPSPAQARVIENPGSDFMVDVLKTLGMEYLAANPGSTFEGLHES